MKKLTAAITKDEDMFVAKCLEVGTVSQGKTVKEALANLKEATELYLEEQSPQIRSQVILKSFEVEELAQA